MSNGCICCTLRDDLLAEVSRLAKEKRFDYLLIESTGISEPVPVAQTFTFEDEEGTSLSQVSRLDTMVTVVDTASLLRDYNAADDLRDRGESLGEDDERTVTDLLIEQIEFANVIVMNKLDLVTDAQAKEVEGVIKALNPGAKVIRATQGQVPLRLFWIPDSLTTTKPRLRRAGSVSCRGSIPPKPRPTASPASRTGRPIRSMPINCGILSTTRGYGRAC